jgi:heme-degrading monooxygenase HmoA
MKHFDFDVKSEVLVFVGTRGRVERIESGSADLSKGIGMNKIFRAWTFWIHAHLREECQLHLESTLLKAMNAAPGNERASALFRDMGDGTTEVVVASVWESMEMILQYAGSDHHQPTIDPADRGKLFDREPTVRHFTMTSEEAILLMPSAWR